MDSGVAALTSAERLRKYLLRHSLRRREPGRRLRRLSSPLRRPIRWGRDGRTGPSGGAARKAPVPPPDPARPTAYEKARRRPSARPVPAFHHRGEKRCSRQSRRHLRPSAGRDICRQLLRHRQADLRIQPPHARQVLPYRDPQPRTSGTWTSTSLPPPTTASGTGSNCCCAAVATSPATSLTSPQDTP
jgi:hypothetical protein